MAGAVTAAIIAGRVVGTVLRHRAPMAGAVTAAIIAGRVVGTVLRDGGAIFDAPAAVAGFRLAVLCDMDPRIASSGSDIARDGGSDGAGDERRRES